MPAKVRWRVVVTVRAAAMFVEMSKEDQTTSPEGERVYYFTTDDQEHAQQMALERFHGTVPIKVIDDFVIDARAVNDE